MQKGKMAPDFQGRRNRRDFDSKFQEEAKCREAKCLQIFMELYFGQIVQSTDLATDLTTKYFGESSPY